MPAKTTGQRLLELREAHPASPTQYDVAEAGRVSRSHYTKIENDRYPPGRVLLRRLAAYFSVSMDYLETGASASSVQVADEGFNCDDKRAWLLFGQSLGADNRVTLVEFANKTILANQPAPGKRVRRHKE